MMLTTASAVSATLAILVTRKADWAYPAAGMGWSLVAGVAGAAGAFCVLLAFGNGGRPGVVMSIVFAGAPIVNAAVAIWLNPPKNGLAAIPWQFYLGIVMAAAGGCLVTFFKPAPAPAAKPAVAAVAAAAFQTAPQAGQ